MKRALASIAVLILAVGLSGCANKNAVTQKFYTPADGVNGQAGEVAIRNVVVVSEGGQEASVLATFVRQGGAEDRLIGIRIRARETTLTPSEISLPLNTPVTVGIGELTAHASGVDVEPGGLAEVEFRFQRAPRTAVQALVLPPETVYGDEIPPRATATPAATPTG